MTGEVDVVEITIAQLDVAVRLPNASLLQPGFGEQEREGDLATAKSDGFRNRVLVVI